jgi:hypothetical protein
VPVQDIQHQVILSYVEKLHDAYNATRSYTNRLLIGLVVVSLLAISIVAGAVSATSVHVGGNEFEVKVWIWLVAGAIFLAVAPGFVVGRLAHMRELGHEVDVMYRHLYAHWDELESADVYPYEAMAVFAKSASRDASVGSPSAPARRGPGPSLKFVGGKTTAVLILLILPGTAEAFVSVYGIRAAHDWFTVAGSVVGLLVLLAVLVRTLVRAIRGWWPEA